MFVFGDRAEIENTSKKYEKEEKRKKKRKNLDKEFNCQK